MRPYIICHMMASIDGRIDCGMTEQIECGNEYYDALDNLECPTMLMGRVTMQIHYAEKKPFKAKDTTPINKECFHKAVTSDAYLVAIDTLGKLSWGKKEFDGKPLLVITSEDCPKEYLNCLKEKNISYIAAGKGEINFSGAMGILYEVFGVRRMTVTGGGHINAGFLKAGLLDEISVMYAPGIDGRANMAAVFDGLDKDQKPTKLHLLGVDQLDDTIWIRYKL